MQLLLDDQLPKITKDETDSSFVRMININTQHGTGNTSDNIKEEKEEKSFARNAQVVTGHQAHQHIQNLGWLNADMNIDNPLSNFVWIIHKLCDDVHFQSVEELYDYLHQKYNGKKEMWVKDWINAVNSFNKESDESSQ